MDRQTKYTLEQCKTDKSKGISFIMTQQNDREIITAEIINRVQRNTKLSNRQSRAGLKGLR